MCCYFISGPIDIVVSELQSLSKNTFSEEHFICAVIKGEDVLLFVPSGWRFLA